MPTKKKTNPIVEIPNSLMKVNWKNLSMLVGILPFPTTCRPLNKKILLKLDLVIINFFRVRTPPRILVFFVKFSKGFTSWEGEV